MHPLISAVALTRRRLVQGIPTAAAAAAALRLGDRAAAQGTPQASPAAATPDGNLLLVDDARTANPDLVEAAIGVPEGFADPGRSLRLPRGFTVSLLASGIESPRFMAFDAAGDLLVAGMRAGTVYRFPAEGGTIAPAPTLPEPIASGLNVPSSLALADAGGQTYLYVGETNQVSRFPYAPGAPLAGGEVVVPDLPSGSGHFTRTVVIGPDGRLYVGVGSSCNICVEADERRAAISRFDADGGNGTIFARGLRNAVGLAFRPGMDELWATCNERDNQGNEIPPDLVTVVRQGADYGWPRCVPPDATPQEAGADCSGVTPPTVGIQAHSAPLGLAFVPGSGFGNGFAGGLIVAQHGSWNRQPPAAPKLLFIELSDGRPTGARDFATGWQDEAGDRWGRPVGVAFAPDGALIVSDDAAGLLYRIAPEG